MSKVAAFEMAQNATCPVDDDKRQAKKAAKREMQIYRPPGLRSGGGGAESAATPLGTTATVPSTETVVRKAEENNNFRGTPVMENVAARTTSLATCAAAARDEQRRLNRTESSLSSESVLSQRSSGSTRGSVGSSGGGATASQGEKKKQSSPPRKEIKKKVMSSKEMADAATALRALQLGTNTAELEQWIAGSFACPSLAECVGSSLCQHAIEGGGGKGVAKICGGLKDCESRVGLEKGLVLSISQYFECRDKLRTDHFRMWISFLNFVSDLYSNVGGGEGELVSFVFRVFDYLLTSPVLESLKIEELESLISALLSVGYDLERECPDQLSSLKDLIRDAFISVTEPWARKMILLLLELGASGWKLPPEANEYYFQQAGS